MPSSVETRALTEAHRLAQIRLAAETVSQTDTLWRLLDLNDLDGTFPTWARAVEAVARRQATRSAATSATYCTTHKAMELGRAAAPFAPRLVPLNAEALRSSLFYNGPVRIRTALAKGRPLAVAARVARSEAAEASSRIVLNSGRGTVLGAVRDDRQALGWARVTSSSCCAFCAMLATRGFVYKSKATAKFEPHNRCHCAPKPSYSADTELPPNTERYREVYREATRGLSGNDALNAFRSALNPSE